MQLKLRFRLRSKPDEREQMCSGALRAIGCQGVQLSQNITPEQSPAGFLRQQQHTHLLSPAQQPAFAVSELPGGRACSLPTGTKRSIVWLIQC